MLVFKKIILKTKILIAFIRVFQLPPFFLRLLHVQNMEWTISCLIWLALNYCKIGYFLFQGVSVPFKICHVIVFTSVQFLLLLDVCHCSHIILAHHWNVPMSKLLEGVWLYTHEAMYWLPGVSSWILNHIKAAYIEDGLESHVIEMCSQCFVTVHKK